MEPSSDLLRNPARLAALIERASLVVTDAENDPRVCDNPAIPDLEVKAYLGVPPTLPSGHVIGSLGAIDRTPRARSDADLRCLGDAAEIVMREIRLRLRAPFVIPIAI